MTKSVVLYHAHCADGFGAALVAWMALGETASYIPVKYGEPIPPIPKETDRVYILDFSYSREQLIDLRRGVDVVVLDHHKTAQAALEGLDFAKFDLSKSGAVLAWEYFRDTHPDAIFGEVPELLLYVQDRDLWKWERPQSREVSAALACRPRTFTEWHVLIDDLTAIDYLINEGAMLLRQQQSLVESIVARAHIIEIQSADGTWQVPAVNTPVLQSECGHRLLEQHPNHPFVAAYFDEPTVHPVLGFERLTRVYSLRSRASFDVSQVAKHNGGGGHPQAAGFSKEITHD